MRRAPLWVALVLGCSSGSSDAPANASDASVDAVSDASAALAACAKVASAYCGKFSSCSEFFVRFGFGDVAGCTKRVTDRCAMWTASPGTAATAASLEDCAGKIPSTSCASVFAGETCVLPNGARADGEPCALDEQCKSGFCPLGDAQCGTCTPAPAEGAPCVGGSCGAKRLCTGMGVCLSPRPKGAMCTGPGQCILPLSCFDGLCSDPAPLDAACSTEGKGAPDCNFLAGEACVSNTCVKVDLAAAGATCGPAPGKLTLCLAGGTCVASPSTGGTCRAAAGDGEPCDESAGTRCYSPARCVSGVCRLPDPSLCR